MLGSGPQDPSHHDSNAVSGQGERGVEDDPCRIPCHAPLRRWGDGQSRGRKGKGREGRRKHGGRVSNLRESDMEGPEIVCK